MKEWIVKWELLQYYDQFLLCGIDNKTGLLQLHKDAGGQLSLLRESLSEIGVDMKPMHAKILLNALHDEFKIV
jgi:hypothetical protein